ncbi:MAG: hypothetical protein ACM3W7_15020, partial [Acidobacteriota bacterium]
LVGGAVRDLLWGNEPSDWDLVTDPKGAEEATVSSTVTLTLPEMASTVTPLVYAVPVQLMAYHTALAIGTDVDQPRNLAKSVTVE